MGLFNFFYEKITERRRMKLKNDLLAIATMDYVFNPKNTFIPTAIVDKANDNISLAERLVWFSGNENAIYEFETRYANTSNNSVNINQSRFWVSAPPMMRHIHAGIPKMISRSMGKILFGKGIKIECEINDDNGNKKVKQSEEATKLLLDMYDELDLNNLFFSAAITNSWSGHVDFKMRYNLEIDYKPIIDVYDLTSFALKQVDNKTVAHVFFSYYKKNSLSYVLEETYTTDEYGNAIILNDLYQVDTNKKTKVPLTTLEETKDLYPELKIGVSGNLAFDLKNLNKASMRANYPYGASDYDGAIGSFDATDEAFTQLISEIRDKKPIREWDERTLEINEDGKKSIKEYVTNFIKIKTDNREDSKVVGVTEFNDETEKHFVKFQNSLAIACANCGISPITLGIPGLIAIDSSDKSIRERSKVTTETRNLKIMLWKPFIEKMLKQCLKFSKWLTTIPGYGNSQEALDWKKKLDKLDLDNLKIYVSFPDYIVDAKETKINTATTAVNGNVMSIETAIDEIYGDNWSEQKKQDEVNRILFRMGMMQEDNGLASLESVTIENESN